MLPLVLAAPSGWAARLALVIGNSAYADVPLKNPVNDARAMEQKLTSLGFKVQKLENLKRQQIGRTVTAFASSIKPGDEVVVFYAGHGVQVKGVNYLPAVDADIQSEEDVPLNSLNLNTLMERLDEAKAGLKLFFLDACRNNPYARSFRSGDRGLARVSAAPSGTLIHFATRPGSVAADGSGANGLYTSLLLRHIDTPNTPVETMLKRVAAAVEAESKGQQEPWTEGSIRGEFFFNAGGTTLASVKPEPIRHTMQPSQAAGVSLEDLEREETIRKEWAAWQARMKADFDRTAAFAGSADLQAKAWERFLAAWAQDNPMSREDDRLREQASLRRDRARQAPAIAAVQELAPARSNLTPGPPGADAAATTAAVDRSFPAKPIRIVVPFAAGGATDMAARTLAQAISPVLGQPVLIDNKPGAGGTVGTQFVQKSSPDGYTLLLHSTAFATTAPMYRAAPFQPLDDFEFLGLISEAPLVVVGGSGVPARSVAEFSRWLQSSGGKVNWANSGTGSPSHLCALLVSQALRAQPAMIPYRGTAPALMDVAGGQADLLCAEAAVVDSQVTAGKVKPLAVASAIRLNASALTNAPTFAEAGVSGVDMTTWLGLYAPKGTPAGVVARINTAVREAVQSPEFRRQQESSRSVAISDGRQNPAGHKRFVEAEIAKWTPLIRAAGITVE